MAKITEKAIAAIAGYVDDESRELRVSLNGDSNCDVVRVTRWIEIHKPTREKNERVLRQITANGFQGNIIPLGSS